MIKEIKNFSSFLFQLFHRIIARKELLVNDDLQQTRLLKCNDCEHIRNVNLILFKTNKCNECGCYLKIKTKFKFEECPDENW